MDNPPQNTQPDFGFIVNQPGLPPKKNRKNFVLFGFAAVALVLVVAAISVRVITGVNKSKQNATISQATTVSNAYFSDIINGHADQAYDLLTPDMQQQASKDTFVQFSSGVINSSFDLTKCSLQSSSAAGTKVTVVYQCPTRNGQFNTLFTMALIPTTSSYKISTYSVEAQSA